MSKHNLMKKIASVATELDYAGFTKEAKNMDLILLKLAQEEDLNTPPQVFQEYFDAREQNNTTNFKELTDFLDMYNIKYKVGSDGVKVKGDLNLNDKNLTSLPESFGYMKITGNLGLNDNNLSYLPESFGNLQIGGSLYLMGNNLSYLPASIDKIKIGGYLMLQGNDFDDYPDVGNLWDTIGGDIYI